MLSSNESQAPYVPIMAKPKTPDAIAITRSWKPIEKYFPNLILWLPLTWTFSHGSNTFDFNRLSSDEKFLISHYKQLGLHEASSLVGLPNQLDYRRMRKFMILYIRIVQYKTGTHVGQILSPELVRDCQLSGQCAKVAIEFRNEMILRNHFIHGVHQLHMDDCSDLEKHYWAFLVPDLAEADLDYYIHWMENRDYESPDVFAGLREDEIAFDFAGTSQLCVHVESSEPVLPPHALSSNSTPFTGFSKKRRAKKEPTTKNAKMVCDCQLSGQYTKAAIEFQNDNIPLHHSFEGAYQLHMYDCLDFENDIWTFLLSDLTETDLDVAKEIE